MRYGADHKQQTRERVIAEASTQLRAHGPDGVGVAEIMKRAGLTHGGFYAHFKSKDALVAAAIEAMFDGALARWHRHAARGPSAGLAAYIDSYLSAAHRDERATGCPLAALAGDVPRLGARCRAAYAAGTRRLTAAIADRLRELGHREPGPLAASVVAELVGALSLARVETAPARANQLLAGARRSLRARLGLGGRS